MRLRMIGRTSKLFCQVKRQDEEKRRLIRERRENGSLENAARLVVGQLLIHKMEKVNKQIDKFSKVMRGC